MLKDGIFKKYIYSLFSFRIFCYLRKYFLKFSLSSENRIISVKAAKVLCGLLEKTCMSNWGLQAWQNEPFLLYDKR